jgi:hypothetical protein
VRERERERERINFNPSQIDTLVMNNKNNLLKLSVGHPSNEVGISQDLELHASLAYITRP